MSEVLTHKGICFAKFNPITRSLLIYYNPTEIECIEIIIRIGISLSVDSDNITLQAFKVLKEDSTKNYYDVAIKQFDQSFNNNNLLKLFTNSIKYFIGINNQENSSMINKIRKISKNHGDILEGLSNNDEMIFLRL